MSGFPVFGLYLQCMVVPPCLGPITRRLLRGLLQPSKTGPLESWCPEATAPWFRVVQRGSTFHSFNFNPPSSSHFHLHCFSSCTRVVAGNTICLCPVLGLYARLCHLLEAVTPSMICPHEGTCVHL